MGQIQNTTLREIKRLITKSNAISSSGAAHYVLWENQAIISDYEFKDCQCPDECWCRKNGCTGHYVIKTIPFEQFLKTYVHLWAPPRARKNVINAIMHDTSFDGWQRNAIPALKDLRENWDVELTQATDFNKCGLCDSTSPKLKFAKNIYEAKLWSQLYYDSLIPFDNDSKKALIRWKYTNPIQDYPGTNIELYYDLRILAEREGLDVYAIRQLDKPWVINDELTPIKQGQPLSRVLDKIFYSP